MRRPLHIVGAGAVTPAGLNARQTIAAFRASLSAFEEITLPDPFGASQVVARVPARAHLRRSTGEWLVNMAARAIREAMRASARPSAATAVLMAPPESFRNHPGYEDIAPAGFLSAVLAATGSRFHPASRAVDGGAAASIGLLGRAVEIMEQQGAEQVLLGGVDSLLNTGDLVRLRQSGRLRNAQNAQGLVPGEGAVFVRLGFQAEGRGPVSAVIQGAGSALEKDGVLSDRFSQGRAMLDALRAAVAGPGPSEPEIDFAVNNGNGERYGSWEALIARPRFYRTHREIMPIAYPAMTVGDLGAASGALSLMVAADSFLNDYAPGKTVMCEVASEGGLRAAAVMVRATRN